MRVLVVLSAIAIALVVAPLGSSGGWATVGFEPLPDGMSAGGTWNPTIFVKQHGVTPLEGVVPSVRIDNGEGVVKTFTARPTDRVGTYVAEVDFPAGGTWKARVYDGFTDAFPHRLSPLTVSPAAGTANGFPWPQTVMIAVVALLFLGGILATLGRPRVHVGTFGLRGRAA